MTAPTEDAAQTGSAAADPEGEGPLTNPLRLLCFSGQGQRLCALSIIKANTAPKKGSDVRELEEPDTSARMATRNPQQSHEAAALEADDGPNTGEPRAMPAAREEPSTNSSHASGEEWPLQVRVTPGKGEKRGWMGEHIQP
ncbi:hypothetical protein NDU88_004877 [Pleurodeles waltl]|uniref:Uncharacterized protein n=1 Tax=Pleurodeles waltl TaxID=8319 RepID=A0AAV7T8R4_PLEWA|nr:hypothetical protein NDU88_004877 [Pleurodeles waltl]